jgi:glycosyltransferase involved in cell wall biosynthesis
MEPILIFSTEVKNGKGGISTALVGFLEGFDSIGCPYETVITHAGKGKLSAYLRAAKRACRVKKGQICWFHLGPWFSILRKLSLMIIARVRGGVVIAHFHSTRTEAYLAKPLTRLLVRVPMSISSVTIALTPWWSALFQRYNPRLQNVYVLSNPADEIMLQQARNPVIPKDRSKVRLLAMTRLVEGKGIEAVINALTLLDPIYSLIIAGTGPLECQLREMVNDLGLNDRVSFTGWVDYSEKSALFDSVDIFCLPSRNDSFGMVYLEAMAAGVPIVALNHGPIPDVVRDGKDGVLIEDESPLTVANGVMMVTNNSMFDPEEIKESFVRRFDSRGLVAGFLMNLRDNFPESLK